MLYELFTISMLGEPLTVVRLRCTWFSWCQLLLC